MFKKVAPKLFVIITAFVGLWYWLGTQSPIIVKPTVNASVIPVITTNPPAILPSTEPAPKVEVPKITVDPTLIPLKEAFASKYNRSTDSVFVVVDQNTGSYVKGAVDFDNSGYPATFYAYNNGTSFTVVAVENGVVSCSAISGYSFPNTLIPQCYNQSSGTVVSR
jgi:hypothetical protein